VADKAEKAGKNINISSSRTGSRAKKAEINREERPNRAKT